MIQDSEVLGKGLTAASGIIDDDARGAQTCQGEAHGHAVVIVCENSAGMGLSWVDGDGILTLLAADAHTG